MRSHKVVRHINGAGQWNANFSIPSENYTVWCSTRSVKNTFPETSVKKTGIKLLVHNKVAIKQDINLFSLAVLPSF